jgi:hypothetical protein
MIFFRSIFFVCAHTSVCLFRFLSFLGWGWIFRIGTFKLPFSSDQSGSLMISLGLVTQAVPSFSLDAYLLLEKILFSSTPLVKMYFLKDFMLVTPWRNLLGASTFLCNAMVTILIQE